MNLEELRRKALEEFERVHDLAALNAWRVKFLGRKSELALALRRLSELPLEERRRLGGAGNALRHELEEKYRSKSRSLTAKEPSLSIDVTRPGSKYARGHLHPLTLVMRRVVEIFGRMGFAVAEGPEIETERNNFDALNIPQWHPARDLMDTFWIKFKIQNSKFSRKSPNEVRQDLRGSRPSAMEPRNQVSTHQFGDRGILETVPAPSSRTVSGQIQNSKLLLRTHTSPVQIRYMETHQPPFRIIAPGRVYRHEATDARHEMQFHQIEGLMVGDDISLSNLKAIIEIFITSFFGPMAKLRVRPGYFPFVEPGVEFDLSCIGCYGKTPKCRLCGGSGWLEFAGAGMVHPNVFRAVGYNPQVLQGFAFGMGVERLAMIKYKIDDIRLFHSGDLRFIKQF